MNVLGLAGLLGLGLAVVFVASVLFTTHRLRTPPRRTRAWAVARGVAGDPGELDEPRSYTTEVVSVAGREVELWEIAGDAADGPVVIVTPGWGDSKVGALVRLDVLAGWGVEGHRVGPAWAGRERGEMRDGGDGAGDDPRAG